MVPWFSFNIIKKICQKQRFEEIDFKKCRHFILAEQIKTTLKKLISKKSVHDVLQSK